MSYSIDVFCLDDNPFTRREIARFVEEGAHFDAPVFDPPPESIEATLTDWKLIEIHYESGRVPVLVHRYVGDAARDRCEIVDGTLYEREIECPPLIAEHLRHTRQVFELEFDRGGGIDGECWAMLDCLESHFARMNRGIVVSYDDGIYDSDLRMILEL